MKTLTTFKPLPTGARTLAKSETNDVAGGVACGGLCIGLAVGTYVTVLSWALDRWGGGNVGHTHPNMCVM